MKPITLYLDMDGVIADFNKFYATCAPYDPDDRHRFREAVMHVKIFEKLDYMPDALELLNHVRKLPEDVNVEILTSMGTMDMTRAMEARRQKLVWLLRKGINYKANFVHTKHEKANYATPTSILIDDSVGCISPFISKGGYGILHVNASESISMLDATIHQIRQSLKNDA